MRQVIAVETLYTISELRELSESAFDRAHSNWCQNVFSDSNDWDHVFSDFCSVARCLRFDISDSDIAFSGFWSQGDGASFSGQYCLSGYGAAQISEYAPKDQDLRRIADALKKSRDIFYKRLVAAIPCELMGHIRPMFTNRNACAYIVITRSAYSRYSHSGGMQSDGGENVSDDIRYRLGDLIDLCDDIAIEHACEEFAENILSDAKSLADWLYSALEKEYEYQTSEESFIDACEANEYEFNESGDMQ